MAFFQPLRAGDKVAVFAPASAMRPERIACGEAEIRRAGYTPYIHPQTLSVWGDFAGTDDERLAALHALYADPSVKAIICARGGYGSQRYVDRIDYALLKANPKPLVGLSDVTELLNAIARQTGQPTFHGPMLGDLSRPENDPANWDYLWQVLSAQVSEPSLHPASAQARVLVAGVAEGPLWGGNLTMLATSCGTPTQVQAAGGVLLIEDWHEPHYRIDRYFWQLKRAGMFDKVAGFLIGELIGKDPEDDPFGQTAEEIVMSHLGGLGVPVIFNFAAGHGTAKTTLPIGCPVKLQAGHDPSGADRIRITHNPLFVSP